MKVIVLTRGDLTDVSLRASTYSLVHFEVLDSRQILISDVEERRDEIVDFRVPQ